MSTGFRTCNFSSRTGVSSVRPTAGHRDRLMAAFRSRSITKPHSHLNVRSARDIFAFIKPQLEHVFVEGKNRSTLTNLDPYQGVLYSSCRTNCDHETSAIDLAKQWFFIIACTDKSSTTMTDLVFASIVVALCRQSLRAFVIRR